MKLNMADRERSLMLFEAARREDVLSEDSLQALKRVDPGRLTLGVPVRQYKEGDNVLLVAALIDDSGSLELAVEKDPKTGKIVSRHASYADPKSNAEAVLIGHNAVIQALRGSVNPSAIWFHTRYLNGRELNPWNLLGGANQMNHSNYTCGGGTPLYDETVTVLASTLAKAEDFKNRWVGARTAVLIVTDGADYGSRLQTPDSVRSVVTDMYNMGNHIIVAMGIDDTTTNFEEKFIEMGIRENLILIPGSTPEEIRKAFGLFGRMASLATDPQNFNKTRDDGFPLLTSG